MNHLKITCLFICTFCLIGLSSSAQVSHGYKLELGASQILSHISSSEFIDYSNYQTKPQISGSMGYFVKFGPANRVTFETGAIVSMIKGHELNFSVRSDYEYLVVINQVTGSPESKYFNSGRSINSWDKTNYYFYVPLNVGLNFGRLSIFGGASPGFISKSYNNSQGYAWGDKADDLEWENVSPDNTYSWNIKDKKIVKNSFDLQVSFGVEYHLSERYEVYLKYNRSLVSNNYDDNSEYWMMWNDWTHHSLLAGLNIYLFTAKEPWHFQKFKFSGF